MIPSVDRPNRRRGSARMKVKPSVKKICDKCKVIRMDRFENEPTVSEDDVLAAVR